MAKLRFVLLVTVLSACAGSAPPPPAPIDPRLTGADVIDRLRQTQEALARGASGGSSPAVIDTAEQLGALADNLAAALAAAAGKPLALLENGDLRAQALIADAAAQRAQAFVQGSEACTAPQIGAAAQALAAKVTQLSAAAGSAEAGRPFIAGAQTLEGRPVFAIRAGGGHKVELALLGAHLAAPGCEAPALTATDASGALRPVQPTLRALLPNRIDLELPGKLQPGAYRIHVVPRAPGGLFGCEAQPEALAALSILPALQVTAEYRLVTTCGAAETTTPIEAQGTLPVITAYGETVFAPVQLPACENPVSTSLSASARFGEAPAVTVGPISQVAGAHIAVGLPGGLRMEWNPAVKKIFLSLPEKGCALVY